MNRPMPFHVLRSAGLTALLLVAFSGCLTPTEIMAPQLPDDPWQAAVAATPALMPPATTSAGPGGGGGRGGGRGPASVQSRLPVADVWVTNTPPTLGFGQYTYLLLARETGPDAEAIRRQNLLLLSTVLARESADTALPRLGMSPRDANHLLVPVTFAVASREPASVYRAYDFSFAEVIRARLSQDGTKGIVLYSSNLPLQTNAPLPRLYIVQRIANCPDPVADTWWRLFLVASNKPDFWEWDDLSGDKILARLYSGLERAAPMFGTTLAQLKSFITIAKGGGDKS